MILCEHPRFIVNPSLPELIAKYHTYCMAGAMRSDNLSYRLLYHFNLKPFNQLLDSITIDNVDDFFVVDNKTGDTFPIYMQVPCGHCTLCTERKVNSLVNRMRYESFLYNCKPIFCTLTYDNKWLPSDGLSVRDTQLFLKRLRINLVRNGFTMPIRYAIVGEYGSRTQRPHYHAIFYGVYADSNHDFSLFQRLLNKSWSYGHTCSRHCDPSNDRATYYTCKYLRKECKVPAGKRPVFFHSSNRHGGLGSKFFLRQRALLRRPVPKFDVLNPFSGRTECFKWTSYALNKIYPTINVSIPLKLRKALKKYLLSYSLWKINQPDMLWLWQTNYERICKSFRKYLYLPFDGLSLKDIPSDCLNPIYETSISEYEQEVLKYIDKDYSNCFNLNDSRQILLGNMQFDDVDDNSLIQRIVKIKRRNVHLKNLEVL